MLARRSYYWVLGRSGPLGRFIHRGSDFRGDVHLLADLAVAPALFVGQPYQLLNHQTNFRFDIADLAASLDAGHFV
ncbi:hypothetical protein D3C75_1331740 [compost metagenome]